MTYQFGDSDKHYFYFDRFIYWRNAFDTALYYAKREHVRHRIVKVGGLWHVYGELP